MSTFAQRSFTGRTLIGHGIAAMSGVSQELMPANKKRQGMLLKNGPNVTVVNFAGGEAVSGGEDCMTFAAYEGVVLEGDTCPTGAITVLGSGGSLFSAIEYI